MFDPFNPTPRQVELTLQIKQARLVDLEKLDRWNEAEAEEVINSALRWNLKHHQWIHDSDIILELAFDARLPDEVAQRLQRLVAGREFIGRPDS